MQRVTTFVDDEIYAKVIDLAQAEDRSISNWVNRALTGIVKAETDSAPAHFLTAEEKAAITKPKRTGESNIQRILRESSGE